MFRFRCWHTAPGSVPARRPCPRRRLSCAESPLACEGWAVVRLWAFVCARRTEFEWCFAVLVHLTDLYYPNCFSSSLCLHARIPIIMTLTNFLFIYVILPQPFSNKIYAPFVHSTDISHNLLVSIPDETLATLVDVERFTAVHNAFVHMPNFHLLSSLTHLNLRQGTNCVLKRRQSVEVQRRFISSFELPHATDGIS